MPVVINGTTGISGVDGTAASPAIEGSDTNTGMFFPAADTIAFTEGGTEAMRIDSSGNLVIGNTTALSKLDVGAVDSADEGGEIRLRGATNGTLDYYADVFQSSMRFVSVDKGTAATNATVRLLLNSSGQVLATSSSLGYGTGAGGTVTQTGNKSTAVTLNKSTGQITMVNTAIAASGSATFTVNNSTVAVGDTVVLAHSSGGTLGNYFARVFAVGAGLFIVNLFNQTAGSLSDATVLSFTVIKGAST